jgi:hypothetical protein
MANSQDSVAGLLNDLAESLDIPPSKYQQAVERYTAVGKWLCDPGSSTGKLKPVFHSQGSFRMGTVIRPIRGDSEGEYDIDVVCKLSLGKPDTTPRSVKELVGDRLKEHETYSKMLDKEGRRCWTLEYAEQDGIGFHMDVLAAIPEDDERRRILREAGVGVDLADRAIAITEKLDGAYRWLHSNPEGFATWFNAINRPMLVEMAAIQKQRLFEQHRRVFASIEAVPDALVRTPLQRTVQLLKRHRDSRFCGLQNDSEKPASILITALAGLSYRQEPDVQSALTGVVGRIRRYATTGIILKQDGKWLLKNPVDPGENLADRWNEPESAKAEAFFTWLEWLSNDLRVLGEAVGSPELEESLTNPFGARVAREVLERRGLPGGTMTTVAAKAVRPEASHGVRPPWPLDLRHRVRLAAQGSRKGFRTFTFNSNRSRLPKGINLAFEARAEVEHPFDLFWQVVNTGREAEADRGLRGTIFKGQSVQQETTRYRGKHWIECFVVKDSVCVARSGEFFINIE